MRDDVMDKSRPFEFYNNNVMIKRMFVGGDETVGVWLFVVDVPQIGFLYGQAGDDLVFAFGHQFISLVVLSLHHSSLLDSSHLRLLLRVDIVLLFECRIIAQEGIQISTCDDEVVGMLLLELEQSILHLAYLDFVFVGFGTEVGVDYDVAVENCDG